MNQSKMDVIKIVGIRPAKRCIRASESSFATYQFDNRTHLLDEMPTVRVMGLGEIGCKILSYVMKRGIKEIEAVEMAFDSGTIQSHLLGTDLVIILAGMSGMNSGWTPSVLASISRNLGIWTIGIMTLTPGLDWSHRMLKTHSEVSHLSVSAHMTLVLPNISTLPFIPPTPAVFNTVKKVNDIAYRAIRLFSDILLTPHLLAMDFADIRKAFPKGFARIGVGWVQTTEKPVMAARAALASPLMEGISLHRARSLICNVNLYGDEKIEDIEETFRFLQNKAPEAELLTHTHIDGNAKTMVTLIAGNFI